MKLTQSYLKSVIHYDPETGDFRWIVSKALWIPIGRIAGSMNSKGYWNIGIDQIYYMAHRLAFLYMTGSLPEHEIDHIDGDRLNNKWANLRSVLHADNAKNQKQYTTNKSGYVGVYRHKVTGKWAATIRHKGKGFHLGVYENIADAIAARGAASNRFEFHENHGRIL